MTSTTQIQEDSADESNYLLECLQRGYNIRIVPYEEIHNIRPVDFDSLARAVDAQDGDTILDAGSGYGAVTRELLIRNPHSHLHFCDLDISGIQLERGIKELGEMFGAPFIRERIRFKQDSILHTLCGDSSYDKAVAKMVIHELPRHLQLTGLQELYRVLKPGGKLVVWDLMLDENTQEFFQRVISKKDELAGYDALVKLRYFLREDEWVELLAASGFTHIKKEAEVLYELHTEKRLYRELKGDRRKLDEWHAYIRKQVKRIPKDVRDRLSYADHGDDITFIPPKAIYSAIKA
jgi:SAM-dependent methyltransferase